MQCTVLCPTWSCALAWGDAHAEAIVASLALIVAVWTVRVLVQQARIAREDSERARAHDRLSVMPKVLHTTKWQIAKMMSPQGVLVGVQGTFDFKLQNFGSGPAAVQETQLRLKNAVVGTYPGEIRERIAKDLAQFGATIGSHGAWDTPPPFWLTKDGSIDVIAIVFQTPTEQQCKQALDYFEGYSIEAKYESAYNEKFEMDSRKKGVL